MEPVITHTTLMVSCRLSITQLVLTKATSLMTQATGLAAALRSELTIKRSPMGRMRTSMTTKGIALAGRCSLPDSLLDRTPTTFGTTAIVLVEVREYDSGGTLTSSVGYTYDGDNLRISRSVDSDGDGTVDDTQHFVYGNGSVTTVLDGSGNPTNRYLHGPQVDQVLADDDGAGGVLWPLADHQGTVRDIAVEQTGLTSIANHRVYDSFGNLTSENEFGS